MATKTTGAEFKRFYSDKEFWPHSNDICHDYEYITVNGEDIDGDFDLMSVQDDALMTIEGGGVYDGKHPNKEQSFEGYFKKWRKKQSNVVLVIEVSKDRLDQMAEAIKAAGGKIVKS